LGAGTQFVGLVRSIQKTFVKRVWDKSKVVLLEGPRLGKKVLKPKE